MSSGISLEEQMPYKWIKTKFIGVRYREGIKKNGSIRKDRYYTIRYKLNGKDKEEAIGWKSEGWTGQKAALKLAELKENQRTGIWEKTLAEKRKVSAEREKLKQESENKSITFAKLYAKYIENQKSKTDNKSWKTEDGFYRNWFSKKLDHKRIHEITIK